MHGNINFNKIHRVLFKWLHEFHNNPNQSHRYGCGTKLVLFNPSANSSIPLLVEGELLRKANTLNQLSTQEGNILGPALAGILMIINLFKDKYKMAIIGLYLEGVALFIMGITLHYYVKLVAVWLVLDLTDIYQAMIPKVMVGRVLGLVSMLIGASIPLVMHLILQLSVLIDILNLKNNKEGEK